MGTIVNTLDFREFGFRPPESKGGARQSRKFAAVNMSNSYIAGGDTLANAIPVGATLRGVNVIGASDVTRDYKWNGSTVTPKIFASVTAGGVEVANAVDLSAVTVFLEVVLEV